MTEVCGPQKVIEKRKEANEKRRLDLEGEPFFRKKKLRVHVSPGLGISDEAQAILGELNTGAMSTIDFIASNIDTTTSENPDTDSLQLPPPGNDDVFSAALRDIVGAE